MSEATFRPPLKITIYLTIIQYLTCFLFLLAFFTIVGSNKSYLYICLLLCVLFLIIVTSFARETQLEGIVKFSYQGLISYSFGQLGKSHHAVFWDEIYAVEPYRYFGLPFLLIRHHSSEYPTWLPLFLNHQTQLNLSILEHTSPNNPLHIALLNKHKFEVPWHSRVKTQKSHLYMQKKKLNNASRLYYSFKHFFWLFLSIEIVILLITIAFWFGFRNSLYYSSIEFIVVSSFFLIMILTMWLCLKNSYVAVNEASLEVNCLQNFTKHHIKWSEISQVEYINLIIIERFTVFSPHSLYGFNHTVIIISLIDKAKFKQAIITHTEPENPLHQAVVRYL